MPPRDKIRNGTANFYGKLDDFLKDQTDHASDVSIENANFELGDLTRTHKAVNSNFAHIGSRNVLMFF